jgi:hypothetical protein
VVPEAQELRQKVVAVAKMLVESALCDAQAEGEPLHPDPVHAVPGEGLEGPLAMVDDLTVINLTRDHIEVREVTFNVRARSTPS